MQVIHLRGFDLPPPEVAEVEIDTHMSSKASATVAAFQPSLSVPSVVKQLSPRQAVAEPHRTAPATFAPVDPLAGICSKAR
jgi:hypothetical protein